MKVKFTGNVVIGASREDSSSVFELTVERVDGPVECVDGLRIENMLIAPLDHPRIAEVMAILAEPKA